MTSQIEDPNHPPSRRRVIWDPTLNITHVINFGMGLIAVVGIYYSLDARLSRQEYMGPILEKAHQEKDQAFQASLNALGSDVKEIKVVVDKVSRNIETQSAVNAALAAEQQQRKEKK